jgi:hypothetical protein
MGLFRSDGANFVPVFLKGRVANGFERTGERYGIILPLFFCANLYHISVIIWYIRLEWTKLIARQLSSLADSPLLITSQNIGLFCWLYGTSYLFVCDPFTPNSAKRGRVGTLFLNVDN